MHPTLDLLEHTTTAIAELCVEVTDDALRAKLAAVGVGVATAGEHVVTLLHIFSHVPQEVRDAAMEAAKACELNREVADTLH